MAEICLDCWNKLNGTNDKPRKFIMSDELDLCEDCGEMKRVIVVYRSAYYRRKLKPVLLPLRVLFFPVEFVIRLIWGVFRLVRTKLTR